MISKELSHSKREVLNTYKSIIFDTYVKVENEFKNLLKQNGEFSCESDYELVYTGCDFPTRCKVEKAYLSEDGKAIYVELKDVECEEEVFDVPITYLESTAMYGDHILNLYALAIKYFTKD